MREQSKASAEDIISVKPGGVEIIYLSPEDQMKFANTLLNPPELGSAMRRALERHAKRIEVKS